MKAGLNYIVLLCIAAVMASCGGNSGKPGQTPTSGDVTIGVDESYKLLINDEIQVFEADYSNALVRTRVATEADVFEMLFNDTIRTIITSRELTDEEVKFLRGKQIVAKTTKIAKDGIAIIINNSNPDSNFRYDQIEGIFKGEITAWDKIDPTSKLGKIEVIFDNNRSGNPRYFKEKFGLTGKFPDYCLAVNSNEEVIKYVENNPGAMGILSVNWISDKNDTTSRTFLKSTKLAAIGYQGDTEGDGPFVKPYQAYIFDDTYPFVRNVYVINCESFSGLGSGFAQFLAGEKGQRIIKRAGIVPATMPIRMVQIKN